MHHQHPDKLNEKIPVNKQDGLKSFLRQELWSTVIFSLMIKFNQKKEMLVTLMQIKVIWLLFNTTHFACTSSSNLSFTRTISNRNEQAEVKDSWCVLLYRPLKQPLKCKFKKLSPPSGVGCPRYWKTKNHKTQTQSKLQGAQCKQSRESWFVLNWSQVIDTQKSVVELKTQTRVFWHHNSECWWG